MKAAAGLIVGLVLAFLAGSAIYLFDLWPWIVFLILVLFMIGAIIQIVRVFIAMCKGRP